MHIPTTIQFDNRIGLFITNIPLGYPPDNLYYPICYAVKAILMLFLVVSMWTISTDDLDDMTSVNRIKYCIDVTIDLSKYKAIPVLVTVVLPVILMFIPIVNIVTDVLWFILTPMYYSILYYSTY